MSIENHRSLARAYTEALWDRGDLSVIDAWIAPHYLRHDPTSPEPIRGPEGLRAFRTMIGAAIPDVRLRVEDVVADGDRVALRWIATGTFQGELLGNAPTGKAATVSGTNIVRLADGKIVEEWANWDVVGMLQQFGVLPAPDAHSAAPQPER